jgi:hypothetical protein
MLKAVKPIERPALPERDRDLVRFTENRRRGVDKAMMGLVFLSQAKPRRSRNQRKSRGKPNETAISDQPGIYHSPLST